MVTIELQSAPGGDTGMQSAIGKRKTKYLPLRTKFILLFCLMITIPFLVIGTITYRKYSDNVERNTMELTNDIVSQINISLDRYVKEIERLTLTPLYDESVMAILKNHSGPGMEELYLTTEETTKMNLFISSLVFDRSEIESVLIFTNDGSIFSNLDQSVRKNWEVRSSDWMDPVKEQDGGLTILPRHPARYYTVPDKEVVSIARVIREPYSNKTLGIVKVDLTNRGFESMLSSVSVNGSRMYITDRNGELIYANESARGGEMNRTGYIQAHAVSDYTGMEVTALIPRDALREDAREISRFTLIISMIGLLFAYMVAVFSSNRLVRPIAHLHGKMRQVQRGLFNERANVTTHDEIGQLTEGFNTMIGEIERLVREVYETRLRERDAELSALQSQIHPHFLYNTLEMMNMLALQGNRTQLSDIVTNLGRLLRYTVDRQEQKVFLQDEVRFVEAYLQIQGMRLGDRLRTEIRVDASYDRCQVPKLILQPLVENVIEHALGEGAVSLLLAARVEGDDLILTVSDDGPGMTRERMMLLERTWHAQHPSRRDEEEGQSSFGTIKKGFALRNVHQRIRLLYGEPYGLTLDRSVECGASFEIRLPIYWGA